MLFVGCTTLFAQTAPPAMVSSPNEQARFLTGLRLPAESVLAPLQQAPDYLAHTREYAATWRKFDGRYFGPMRSFAAAQITPRMGLPKALYYLFSGPDFINAYAFFPDVPVYILVGLEPVGSIVPPEQLDLPRLKASLDNLRKSTSVTLQFSYFITKDMKVDFEQTDFKGVLPIIESFIALGGGEILSVDVFSPGDGLPGVRIVFRKNSAATPQTVYYVRGDLSNDGLKSKPALLKWLGGYQPAVAYLKAASYLMHEPYFSTVRNFLLSKSSMIVQDDSGIPLSAFVASGPWSLNFYGAYNGTLDLFKGHVQPDLTQAYQQQHVVPLTFGTGYKFKLGESNLMIAVRQSTANVVPPIVPSSTAPVPAAEPPIAEPPAVSY
jgi:hypothetical protein